MATASRVGGRNWKRARADITRHLASASQSAVLVRRAAHLQVAHEIATDIVIEIAAALAALNELVAVVEANEGSEHGQ